MFLPIKTDRLLLRPAEPDDALSLAARRSDADVARFQSWTTPYDLKRAEQLLDAVVAQPEPQDDQWWMLTIVDEHDTIVGDLAIHPSWGGRSVEIGYTLARAHWGKGYATEAVAALAEYYFTQTDAVRLHAMLHPDNHASAAVLERTGFIYEGRTKLSYWVGSENTDDLLYGMTRADWRAWRDRPPQPPTEVTLVPIDSANKRAVSQLATHQSQLRFVAPVAMAIREALFPDLVDGHPATPWLRAIEADGELAGIVLLATMNEHHDEPILWRLLIDRSQQRRQIGSRVLDLVIEECRAQGATSLLIDWTEGPGSPRSFYEARGAVTTGRIVDGETEARLVF